jgi:PAS domain S-box-containing protein
MERISGVKREHVLGKYAFELFPCLKETGEDKYYFEALAGRSVVAENRPYTIAQSGSSGFFDGYYSPRHDEKGEVVGGVAIIRDVTERKIAEASALDDHSRLAFHVQNAGHPPRRSCSAGRLKKFSVSVTVTGSSWFRMTSTWSIRWVIVRTKAKNSTASHAIATTRNSELSSTASGTTPRFTTKQAN